MITEEIDIVCDALIAGLIKMENETNYIFIFGTFFIAVLYFEHFMGVKPCIQIINYNNTNFYILEEDYNDAIILLENYLKTKTLNNYKIKEKIRNIFELACMSWVIYSPQNNLGIEINYKKYIKGTSKNFSF